MLWTKSLHHPDLSFLPGKSLGEWNEATDCFVSHTNWHYCGQSPHCFLSTPQNRCRMLEESVLFIMHWFGYTNIGAFNDALGNRLWPPLIDRRWLAGLRSGEMPGAQLLLSGPFPLPLGWHLVRGPAFPHERPKPRRNSGKSLHERDSVRSPETPASPKCDRKSSERAQGGPGWF